jgi:PAC2 family
VSSLQWSHRQAEQSPFVLIALKGWFDAGEAATGALDWLEDHYEVTELAEIQADEFFDFQQERPFVTLSESGERSILWPSTRVLLAEGEDVDPFILINGTEPHVRWRLYVQLLDEILAEYAAPRVVTLGAMVGGIPHTRQLAAKGSSADKRIAARYGLQPPKYQGPTGVLGVLHQALDVSDRAGISLHVPVPHYAASGPSPKAMLSLLAAVQRVTDIPTHHEALYQEAELWVQSVSEAVGEDEQLKAYIGKLEEHRDADLEEQVSSSGDVAAALEEFLRRESDS